tara:strand:- start:139 stop:369 length:231 start_codon:yes stop_codon:yes gene_type:complete
MDIGTKKLFQKIFGKKITININSNMNNTYDWDSLMHIRIMSEIEKKFKKKLNINQVLELTSTKKIDNFLRKNEKKF